MKYIKYTFSLIMFLIVFNCMAQDDNVNYNKINYSAQTRGSSIVIIVNENIITYKSNTINKKIELTKEDAKELSRLIKSIDLKGMYNLKAPTNRRNTDGALHAEFQITVKDNEYKSCLFDAGNAPKELKKLEDLLYKICGVE